jgi:hypothetical protein
VEDPRSPELLAMPVEAETVHHGAQPSSKGRWSLRLEAAEASEPLSAQLLAHEEKTIGDRVRVLFREPDDLENERGVRLQEFNPGFLGVGRLKLTKKGGGLPVVHWTLPPLGCVMFGPGAVLRTLEINY